jgi:pimeloyl-ACP methyl ester carboxylesterase
MDSSTPGATAKRLALLSLPPLALAGGFLGGRLMRVRHDLPLPPALEAEIEELRIPFGRVAYYADARQSGTPLLLIHSINAAGSAYEVKPLFAHYAAQRPVYAIDLPGFGLSDRRDRIYTPRLMSDAILALVEAIRAKHGPYPIDAIALSLSCEFLARAANDHPTMFRSLGLISPTGFERKLDREGPSEATFGRESVRDLVSFPLWGRALFDALVSKPSLRFFLQKTWGSRQIDEGLFHYDYLTAHQSKAEFAPFSFIAGFLFSRDALTLYKGLMQPILFCHGIRGDFVDYGKKSEIAGRPNWSIHVFPTGALPHFERLADVTAAYDGFLAQL